MDFTSPATISMPASGWRTSHLGRLLSESLRRFDTRVQTLMAHSEQAPLALSNLAARGKVSAAIVHITRHLDVQGSRLTDLAQAAAMSKQAMATLVDECEAWGLVRREKDSRDARAKTVVFTETGLQWLGAFQTAVSQAQEEMKQDVGDEVMKVLSIGLEAYARGY
jgi:DNA-binding MarR family transcriptional regulator